MEDRPYYKPGKYDYCNDDYEDETICEKVCENICEDDCHNKYETKECNQSCPTDPDLLLLRINAKGERAAIAFYLMASTKTSGSLCHLFLDTSRDEMMHFRRSMILLAKYDPMQAQAFEEVGINLPFHGFRKSQSTNNYCYQDRLEVIDLLTRAITDELEAINLYQESYEKACHDDVKTLFCKNGNDEKMHVAEFWRALMMFTKEGNRPS